MVPLLTLACAPSVQRTFSRTSLLDAQAMLSTAPYAAHSEHVTGRPTMRSASSSSSSSSSTGCVQPSLRHLARRLAGKKPIDESRRCWPLPLPFVSRMAA